MLRWITICWWMMFGKSPSFLSWLCRWNLEYEECYWQYFPYEPTSGRDSAATNVGELLDDSSIVRYKERDEMECLGWSFPLLYICVEDGILKRRLEKEKNGAGSTVTAVERNTSKHWKAEYFRTRKALRYTEYYWKLSHTMQNHWCHIMPKSA